MLLQNAFFTFKSKTNIRKYARSFLQRFKKISFYFISLQKTRNKIIETIEVNQRKPVESYKIDRCN